MSTDNATLIAAAWQNHSQQARYQWPTGCGGYAVLQSPSIMAELGFTHAANDLLNEAEMRLIERDIELQRLRGEAKVYRQQLAQCADVIYTIEGKDSTESYKLSKLHQACEAAITVVL